MIMRTNIDMSRICLPGIPAKLFCHRRCRELVEEGQCHSAQARSVPFANGGVQANLSQVSHHRKGVISRGFCGNEEAWLLDHVSGRSCPHRPRHEHEPFHPGLTGSSIFGVSPFKPSPPTTLRYEIATFASTTAGHHITAEPNSIAFCRVELAGTGRCLAYQVYPLSVFRPEVCAPSHKQQDVKPLTQGMRPQTIWILHVSFRSVIRSVSHCTAFPRVKI